MNYGDSSIKVRGNKYKLDYREDGTYATNSNGVEMKISATKVAGNLAKSCVKRTWKLKPYREVPDGK